MNKEKFRRFLVFFLAVLWLAGCTSEPVKPVAAGVPLLIESKAQIKNAGESHTVKIEIAVWPKKAVRLEISATLGVSVATVLMTPSEIRYALHSPKQFVTGPFHEKTLYPIFKKNIDPRILWKAVHNQSPAGPLLKCEAALDGRPLKCVGEEGLQIKWMYELPPRKRIDIISNGFEMNWIFKSEQEFTASQNGTFVLNIPDGYREIFIK